MHCSIRIGFFFGPTQMRSSKKKLYSNWAIGKPFESTFDMLSSNKENRSNWVVQMFFNSTFDLLNRLKKLRIELAISI